MSDVVSPALSVSKPTILIVDDVPANILALRKLLNKVDAEVMEASSGNEALGLSLKNDFALILLDVQMPDMDGYEVAELMSEEASTRNVPIIFLTAINVGKVHRHRGYSAGAVDYIEKPIDEFILLSKVKLYMDLWSGAKRLQAAVDELTVLNYNLQHEITQREKAEKKLQHIARHDALTGLPNRLLFKYEFEKTVARALRSGCKIAVLFMDIDGFKPINDTLGHDKGDEVLIQVSQRILNCMREVDTVARFGGDEFVAILSDINSIEDITAIADRVVEQVSLPFEVQGEAHNVGISMGGAIYPDHGESQEDLLLRADKKMYEAKQQGGNRFIF